MKRILHEDAGAEELAVARIAVFGLWLVIIAMIPVTSFPLIPSELIEPVGVMRLLPVETILGSPVLVVALKAAAIVGCLLCIAGVRRYQPVAVLTVLLLLFHDGAMRSLSGFDIHLRMAALFVAGVLAIFPAADALSLQSRGRPAPDRSSARYSSPMILASLVIALSYSLVGIRRLTEAGLEVFTGDSARVWMIGRSLQPSEYGFDAGTLLLEYPLIGSLAGFALLGSSCMEAASPLAMRFSTFRRFWILAIFAFHLGILLTMNIYFKENLFLILVFFTGVTGHVASRVRRQNHASLVRASG